MNWDRLFCYIGFHIWTYDFCCARNKYVTRTCKRCNKIEEIK